MPEKTVEKVYSPADVEEKWIAFWERARLFHASLDRAGTKSFSMVIPPPNVTGSLHLGHALNNTLQDILARWMRMRGFNVLWVPGIDHAGIATQNVVERQLAKQGIDRQALGREAFIKRVWEWKETSGGTILKQLHRLGTSCDWERERFTLDQGLSRAVREVFAKLYQEGLIYRAKRLINWCPRCQTALSDIEVEHEEIAGKMYHVKYPLVDEPEMFLTVATTRPETMFGDTAVAVHPEDLRFSRLIGKRVSLPLTDRNIPIVGDALLVDREFGTGAVKITPGHDFNDEKAGRRHQLPTISLLGQDGTMQAASLNEAKVKSEYRGLLSSKSASLARKSAVQWLSDEGALINILDHRHAIGKCYRCKTVIEPMQSPQWFVKVNDPQNSLAQPAIDAVRNRKIRLIPESWEANYFGWMEQIEDWCISRQIWWGHQIPAWYCIGNSSGQCLLACKEPIVSATPPDRCPHCGSKNLRQDPDVLDTWFSSALWPFSTLGWPAALQPSSAERDEAEMMLKTFYPTSTLVTSFDILFFWVARMIMMGLHFMKEVPFRDVYLHALVRDAEGEKMSKSKGNTIDPLEIMHQYGTDAIRFTLAAMASPGRDIKLSPERIEGYRNFANKLWNSFRFIEMNLPEKPASGQRETPIRDRWIKSRLHRTIQATDAALKDYRFDEAANVLYQFIWHEFCDWYLELVKIDLQEGDEKGLQTALSLFEVLLKLLHPFMPFITEELWSRARNHRGDSIAMAAYPKSDSRLLDKEAEETFSAVIHLISTIRKLRGEMGIAPSEILTAQICLYDKRAQTFFDHYLPYIKGMSRISVVSVGMGLIPPKMAATIPTDLGDIHIHLSEARLEKEIARLKKAIQQMDETLSEIEEKHANHNFMTNAPKEVVEKSVQKQAQLKEERAKTDAHLQRFCNMIDAPDATSSKRGE